ncbi:MAG: exosortase [Kiritimatiellaeota bacterium]|nr:exosortase [Kiritimatiellota bacterium]
MNTLRKDWVRWGGLLLLIVAGGFYYQKVFHFAIAAFSSKREDMSHGFLIPFGSLAAIWWTCRDFRNVAGAPSWRGLGWVCFFLGVAWFGARGGQMQIEQVSLIGLIWAIPYALWGKGVGRLMLFPAWFLLFTVPVTNFFGVLTVPLRIFSTGLATFTLRGFNLVIEQSGTAVLSQIPGHEFSLDVVEACSGIRSFFALAALTAGYAYVMVKNKFQRWLLFACTIPIAVLGNAVRLGVICIIAYSVGAKIAAGALHGYLGLVIFVAVSLTVVTYTAKGIKTLAAKLYRANKLLAWLYEPDVPPSAPARQPTRVQVVTVAALVCALTLLTFQSRNFFGAPMYDATNFIADDLPHQIAGFTSDRPWFCHSDQCFYAEEERILTANQPQQEDGFTCPFCHGPMHTIAAGELNLLPADTTILKRNYRSSDGHTYIISVVISGVSRASIHRAELCLPAQGYTIQRAGLYSLNVPGGKPRHARIVQAQHSLSPRLFTLTYWFVSREWECASSAQRICIDVWDRSIHNRINRWAMVSANISPPLETDEDIAAFEAFLGKFYPQLFRNE